MMEIENKVSIHKAASDTQRCYNLYLRASTKFKSLQMAAAVVHIVVELEVAVRIVAAAHTAAAHTAAALEEPARIVASSVVEVAVHTLAAP
jgi:hypothetical protein